MFCPKCGKQIPDDAKFCGGCGNAVNAEKSAVPVSGVVSGAESPVVFPPMGDPANPVGGTGYEAPPVTGGAAPKKTGKSGKNLMEALKKIPSKVWKIGGIALAAVVVVVVLICVFAGGSSGTAFNNGSGVPDGALYLKDGELCYSDYSKKAPWEITDDLWDDASNYMLSSYESTLARTIHVTEDGKTMFFMDKLDSDGTGTLYVRSLSNMNQEATKISGGVSRYTVSRNGKMVLYLKNGTLYQYNMKEETKLAKDVLSYNASDDCKTVYYRNVDDNWYVARNGESEKIGSDITVEQYSEDYSTIYYISDGKLYRKPIGKDKEKLLSNVNQISSISDDGTFYFSREQELPLIDFFVYDGSENDSALDYYLEGITLSYYEIGYFNGKTDTVLGEYCDTLSTVLNGDNYIKAYTRYDVDGAGTITTTELMQYYTENEYYYLSTAAKDMVTQRLEGSAVFCVAVNGTENAVDLDSVYLVRIGNEGKTLYILCDVEEEEGDLYRVAVSGTSVKKPELIDDGVYASDCRFYDDKFVYFKDVKDDTGDLYVDGSLVDSDVCIDLDVEYNFESKELIYMTDYNENRDYATMKVWNGKSVAEVCDEAAGWVVLETGDVLVAYDPSSDGTASLAVWNGSKFTEICDDVYSVDTTSDTGSVLVATDYSERSESVTLQLWDGKKLTEISDDVYDATVLPNGDVLYLYDYNTSKYEGELYLFNGRKAQMVDEDVAAIITLPGTVTHYFGY